MQKWDKKTAFNLINWLLKGTIAAVLMFTIYKQAFAEERLSLFFEAVKALPGMDNWRWLALAFLLLPANWILETQKWRCLLWPFWKISFQRAFSGVMAGVSLSLFTPNRVGEYGGRLLAVPARYNWHAVMAALVGNLAQLLILIGGGLLGALYVAGLYYQEVQLLFSGFWWLAVMLLGLVYVLFFNIGWLSAVARMLPLPRKALRLLLLLKRYSSGRLGLALGLAAARYATYSLQFFCLLAFFGLKAPVGAALAGIATIFLIQTSIPLPPVLGLLARGEAALLALGPHGDQDVAILAATFALFIINLGLPALVGMAAIFKINVLKSLGYEIEVVQNEPDRRYADTSYGFRLPGKD
ncbi:MAG: flippase-like domain-containing protein [Lewinellaceae bacterium]|nr:flippase-like domain-containing protein [Phaeodactylibacter sp.]MCB0612229.1 flippase-like domain-containing protein [Phaeodactylibacter sp.]MCB9348679.1 flippase-like domain-containing protein [Lewinellaceae bacterium]